MYFFEALQYPFNSKGWISKAAIGAVLMIIPILGWFTLAGYMVRIIREVMDGNQELPEYDYGADFSRGLMIFLFSLAYEIPAIIIAVILRSVMGQNVIGQLLASVVGFVISLLITVAMIRYAQTEDTSVYLQLGENANTLTNNLGTVISYFINTLLFGVIAWIMIVIGIFLCVIPALILAPMLYFGYAYMIARFGQDLNLTEGKAKNFA